MDIARELFTRGYLPTPYAGEEAVSEGIAHLQRDHDLLVTGRLDRQTERVLYAPRYCDHSRLAIGEGKPGFGGKVAWYSFSNSWQIKMELVGGCAAWATAEISRVCGLKWVWVKDAFPQEAIARVYIKSASIDGPGRVLGESQLSAGPGTYRQTYDRDERWGWEIIEGRTPGVRVELPLVMLHELCHAAGIPHITGRIAVMNPTYNPALQTLQAADVEALQAIYGPPSSPPPPPPPPIGSERIVIEGTNLKVIRAA